jgi:hypothetical protein
LLLVRRYAKGGQVTPEADKLRQRRTSYARGGQVTSRPDLVGTGRTSANNGKVTCGHQVARPVPKKASERKLFQLKLKKEFLIFILTFNERNENQFKNKFSLASKTNHYSGCDIDNGNRLQQ